MLPMTIRYRDYRVWEIVLATGRRPSGGRTWRIDAYRHGTSYPSFTIGWGQRP